MKVLSQSIGLKKIIYHRGHEENNRINSICRKLHVLHELRYVGLKMDTFRISLTFDELIADTVARFCFICPGILDVHGELSMRRDTNILFRLVGSLGIPAKINNVGYR